ncbi:hypothetical protein V496_02038 [Pseudogymnoascus sp. VKM F-4515 (FW-2607)]|nr:hypothetical protein V496_02038 [Pseudogymnoascus sp. VKM F-4515 (FW-2607)]KFY94579.1 hypothetical protein V498_03846 [Pseudogymnoascus sp. VKM F-4517 (FW-2822)]
MSTFSTPENTEFYSSNPYTVLNKSQQEIRLIKVLPDDKCGFINCELLPNSCLAEVRGAYNALSYCAGNLRKTGVVLVNGVKCNVFANLKHALVEARHFWRKRYKDREFLLWVDQLCIDQSNFLERSQQVGIMRDIYQPAERVIICLSTEKCSGRGMTWLVKLYDNIPPLENDLEVREEGSFLKDADRDEDSDNQSVSTNGLTPTRYHAIRLQRYIWDNVLDEDFLNGWLAFYDILECQWWKRAWVFQEFITSTQSWFIYGRKSITWANLSPMLASIIRSHYSLLTSRHYFLAFNQGFDLDGPEDRQLCRVIDRSTRDGCRVALDSVKFIVTSKLKWTGSTDLKCLLAHSRYCESFDDRDRVYVFLGLGDPGYRITPDYHVDNSTTQVLIDTTKNIILFEDSLEVLCHAVASQRDTSRNLPSWVVDWTCPELGRKRDKHFGGKLSNHISGIKKMKANCSFYDVYSLKGVRSSMILEVWGFHIDTLRVQIISNLDSLEDRTLYSAFETARGHTACTSSLVQCRDQLWILEGATVPLILRPQENGYLVISSALVMLNKIMDDSERPVLCLIDLVENGEVHRQQISLV